jgi:hypothetical protein
VYGQSHPVELRFEVLQLVFELLDPDFELSEPVHVRCDALLWDIANFIIGDLSLPTDVEEEWAELVEGGAEWKESAVEAAVKNNARRTDVEALTFPDKLPLESVLSETSPGVIERFREGSSGEHVLRNAEKRNMCGVKLCGLNRKVALLIESVIKIGRVIDGSVICDKAREWEVKPEHRVPNALKPWDNPRADGIL